MRRGFGQLALAVGVVLVSSTTALAEDDWAFRVSPYAWYLNIDGDFTVQELNGVDASSTLFDDLDGAFMIEGEVTKGPYALFGEFNYIDLDQSASAAGGFFGVDVEVDGVMSSLSAGYQLVDTGASTVHAFAGVRSWWIDTTVKFRRLQTRSVDKSWNDPIIGLRGSTEIGDGFFIDGVTDIGGFGVGSEFQWEVIGRGGYAFNDHIAVAVGYRYLRVDFDENPLILDAEFKGPFAAVDIRF